MSNHLTKDPFFFRLRDVVIEYTGLAYYKDKDEDFASRLSKRFIDIGSKDCYDYLELITHNEKGEEELDRLIVELTIGESYFFRHQEQFDLLRDRILPEVIENNKSDRRLRIWSAGCSTGEEPYSIAILLGEVFGRELKGWDVQILATDVNRQSLSRAQAGVYGEWSFRLCPDGLKEKHFKKKGRLWHLRSKFKNNVTFQYHNLMSNPLSSLVQNRGMFDVVICRNAMIYFTQEISKKVIKGFYESLVEKGWLITGHAELSFENSLFQVNQLNDVTFFRKGSEKPNPIETLPAVPPICAPIVPIPKNIPSESQEIQAIEPEKDSPPLMSQVRQWANQGEWKKAATLCKEDIDQGSLDPHVHFYYALILEHMGTHELAQTFFQKTLYLDRNFVLAHYHFGLFFLSRGNIKNAVRSFQNVDRLLNGKKSDEVIPIAEGMTVVELKELTRMQLEHLLAA